MNKQITKQKKIVSNKKIKCWEILKCKETTCPAYKSRNLKCWLIQNTKCRNEIQGLFIEKLPLCLDCKVFKLNFTSPVVKSTFKQFNKQIQEYIAKISQKEKELEDISLELAITLSEVFEALKKISKGEPDVFISEYSSIEIISKLKQIVNQTSKDITEIINLTHEIAIGLAEAFDVLNSISQGDFNKRIEGTYKLEILNGLKKLVNEALDKLVFEMNRAKKAEIDIKNLEEIESSILNAIPHAVVGLKNRTFIFANPAVEKVFGYKPKELIGMNTRILYRTDEEYEEIGRLFYPVLEKEKFHSENFPCRKKDGTDFICRVTASVIGEKLIDKGIVVVYEDISDKLEYENKLLKAAEAWRETFDSLPYGVMLIDKDLYIIRVNNYIVKTYNQPYENIIGRKINEIIYRENKKSNRCPISKSCKELKPEIDIYFDNHLNKYFMLYSVPIKNDDGSLKSCILSIVDITDLKIKEKKLTDSRDAFLNMLKELDFSYKELKELFTGFIHAFVNAIDAKSPWTKGHSERVTKYSLKIAEELALSQTEIEKLRISALLHDIGKIGTYETLLDKPGRLTEEEFKIVKAHPVKAVQILSPIKQLNDLLPIIKHHHERFDGNGYPDGIQGEEIPLLSRIITVADSFDAMTSDRPYRPAPTIDFAIQELRRCTGTQFDPEIVEAFIRCLERDNK